MSDESGSPAPNAPAPMQCYRHPDRVVGVSCQRCSRPICGDCMRDAAVGFQCPDCVAQGAKETRQAELPYGGRRQRDPSLTSKVLIGLNVAVFIALFVGSRSSAKLYDFLALTPLARCVPLHAPAGTYYPGVGEARCLPSAGGRWVPGVDDGAWWQLFTSMFSHLEIWHIAFNMLALLILGPQLELILGRARFLAVYLLSGLTGSAAVLWLAPPESATIGASGAIFGLMGALLIVMFKAGGQFQQLLIWLGINLVITFVGGAAISWQGHLGGLLGGLVITAIIVFAPRSRRGLIQGLGLAAYALALVAVIAARAVTLG